MEIKDEALKLAEIAESLAIELPADWSSGEPKNIMTDISAMIRKLVEELDKQGEPYCWEFCGTTFYDKEECFAWWEQMKKTGEMLSNHPPIPLYTAPQTKQSEPVAIVKSLPLGTNGGEFKYADDVRGLDVGTKLYTTPQTKPLTDDEIINLWHKAHGVKHGN